MSPTANDEGRGRGGSLAAMPSSLKTLHYVEENRAQCILWEIDYYIEERGGAGWPVS